MQKLEIVEADFSKKEHRDAILWITDNYAKDPMGLDKPLPRNIRENLVEEMEEFPGTLCFIAFVDDTPAGIANCIYSFSTFNAAKIINIHDLAVMPDYRSRGIGEALISSVEKKASEMNCCKITLEVREDNRARNLYEKVGFSYGEPRMLFMSKDLESKN